MDLFMLWPGRCGICHKVWTGPCYHPHPNDKRGTFITQKVQRILKWADRRG